MAERKSKDGTGRGLVDFFSWAAKKGLLNKNTAGARRAAAQQVLAVEDDWENVDVRTLEVEDLLRRFANLRKQDFTPKSLETYQSRFRKALQMYLDYLDNPATWRPSTRERPSAGQRQRSSIDGKPTAPAGPQTQGSPAMVEYPFPVREGVFAYLTLPMDLRAEEARRLGSFLESLAVAGERKALQPGKAGD